MDRLFYFFILFISLTTLTVSQPQSNLTADYTTTHSSRKATFAAIAVDRNNDSDIGAGICNGGYISDLKIHIRPNGGGLRGLEVLKLRLKL